MYAFLGGEVGCAYWCLTKISMAERSGLLLCIFLRYDSCGCTPVSVFVVVMCGWQQAALFPEGPGPCRRPASSSYTVYTKLCMYKIEKSARKTKHMEG